MFAPRAIRSIAGGVGGAGSPELAWDPWDARLDLRGDFVVDGVGPGSELLGGDFFVLLRTQEHDFIAGADIFDIGDVRHAHVHADAPSNRGSLAMDENMGQVGERTMVAIEVADREDGDFGRVGCLVGTAVAYKCAGGDIFDLGDKGFPCKRRPQDEIFCDALGTHPTLA